MAAAQQVGTERDSASTSRKRIQPDREIYSHELDWFLTCRDAACGVRSSLAGQVAAIERGGAGAGANTDPYHDGQAGLGPAKLSTAFARDRKMLRRWNRLERKHQMILVAYYVGLAPQDTGDDAFGPRVPEPDADGNIRVLDPGKYRPRRRFPLGVEGQFAKFSPVVIHQSDPKTLAKVLKAAAKAIPGQRQPTLEAAKKRAENAVRAAHQAYYEIVLAEDFGPEPPERSWQDLWEEFRDILETRTVLRQCKGDGVYRERPAK